MGPSPCAPGLGGGCVRLFRVAPVALVLQFMKMQRTGESFVVIPIALRELQCLTDPGYADISPQLECRPRLAMSLPDVASPWPHTPRVCPGGGQLGDFLTPTVSC